MTTVAPAVPAADTRRADRATAARDTAGPLMPGLRAPMPESTPARDRKAAFGQALDRIAKELGRREDGKRGDQGVRRRGEDEPLEAAGAMLAVGPQELATPLDSDESMPFTLAPTGPKPPHGRPAPDVPPSVRGDVGEAAAFSAAIDRLAVAALQGDATVRVALAQAGLASVELTRAADGQLAVAVQPSSAHAAAALAPALSDLRKRLADRGLAVRDVRLQATDGRTARGAPAVQRTSVRRHDAA